MLSSTLVLSLGWLSWCLMFSVLEISVNAFTLSYNFRLFNFLFCDKGLLSSCYGLDLDVPQSLMCSPVWLWGGDWIKGVSYSSVD